MGYIYVDDGDHEMVEENFKAYLLWKTDSWISEEVQRFSIEKPISQDFFADHIIDLNSFKILVEQIRIKTEYKE